jgi:hypothetical protein
VLESRVWIHQEKQHVHASLWLEDCGRAYWRLHGSPVWGSQPSRGIFLLILRTIFGGMDFDKEKSQYQVHLLLDFNTYSLMSLECLR